MNNDNFIVYLNRSKKHEILAAMVKVDGSENRVQTYVKGLSDIFCVEEKWHIIRT